MTKSLTARVSGSENDPDPWKVSRQGIGDAGRGSNMLNWNEYRTYKNFLEIILSFHLMSPFVAKVSVEVNTWAETKGERVGVPVLPPESVHGVGVLVPAAVSIKRSV